MDIQDLRRNYTYGTLNRSSLPQEPMHLFRDWFALLQSETVPGWFEVNAMTLSTLGLDGSPASRTVLLKHFDDTGFTFFTNYCSAKAQHIQANHRVALHFFWPMMDRQVRVQGIASKTDSKTSDDYFHSRPRLSQLGAIASAQSEVIDEAMSLEAEVERLDRLYAGKTVPRPEHWGGYQVVPVAIEFWQGKPSRLHDRFRYRRSTTQEDWAIERLAP